MSETELKRAARVAAMREIQVHAALGALMAENLWQDNPAIARAKAILEAPDEESLLSFFKDPDWYLRRLNGAERDAVWRYRGWDPDRGRPIE